MITGILGISDVFLLQTMATTDVHDAHRIDVWSGHCGANSNNNNNSIHQHGTMAKHKLIQKQYSGLPVHVLIITTLNENAIAIAILVAN